MSKFFLKIIPYAKKSIKNGRIFPPVDIMNSAAQGGDAEWRKCEKYYLSMFAPHCVRIKIKSEKIPDFLVL
jgi:hypothetical protein